MDRGVTKNFRHRVPRYVYFACKTSRAIHASSTWIEKYRVTKKRDVLSGSLGMGLLTPHCPVGTKGWTRIRAPPRWRLPPRELVYTLYGYRSSGLPRRKDGFCERVTRGSPGYTRLCLDLIDFSYFRVAVSVFFLFLEFLVFFFGFLSIFELFP